MALYEVPGPDGQKYQFEAATDEEAAAAVTELHSQGGEAKNFDQGFNPSAPNNMAAERPELAGAMDENIHGEADKVGRGYKLFNSALMDGYDEIIGLVEGGMEFVKGGNFSDGYARGTGNVRDAIAQYERRHPTESMALGVAASLPTAMIPGGAAVKGANLLTKAGRGAAAGGAYGTAQGYASGEGGVQNRVENAAVGGAIGGLVGGAVAPIGAGIGRLAGKKAGRATVPTSQQYEDAGSALYKAADEAGVIVSPVATDRLRAIRRSVSDIFTDANASAESFKELYPKTVAALQVVDGLADRGLTLRNIEEYRKVLLGAAMGARDKADGTFASAVLRKYDDWVRNLHHGEFIDGGGMSGPAARQMYVDARQLWKTKSRAQTIEAVVQAARDATVDTPGRSAFVNALTAGFKRLRRDEHLMAGFSDQDREFITAAAGGKRSQRVLRWIDEKSPGFSASKTNQNVLWGLLALPAAPVAGAVGLGSKIARNRSVVKAADEAGLSARAGGGPIPFDRAAATQREDFANRLLGAAGQTGGGQVLDLGNVLDRGTPARMIPAR